MKEFLHELTSAASPEEKLALNHPTMMFHVVGAYWFPVMLFLTDILFYAIADFALKSTKRCILICMILFVMGGLLIWMTENVPKGIHGILIFTGCMLLGAVARQKRDVIIRLMQMKYYYIVFLFLLVLYIVLVACFDPGSMARSQFGTEESNGQWLLCTVLQGILFSNILIFLCSKLVRWERITKILLWYGKNTLMIMYIHCFIAFILCNLSGIYFHMLSMVALKNGLSIEKPYIVILETLMITLLTLTLSTFFILKRKKAVKKRHFACNYYYFLV